MCIVITVVNEAAGPGFMARISNGHWERGITRDDAIAKLLKNELKDIPWENIRIKYRKRESIRNQLRDCAFISAAFGRPYYGPPPSEKFVRDPEMTERKK